MTDDKPQSTTNHKPKSTIRRIFARKNFALFISLLALFVSYLGYHQATSSPRLFVTGYVVETIYEDDTKYLSKITVQNLGDTVATAVTISINYVSTESPEINLVPPRQFTSELKGHTLHVRFDALGANDELSMQLQEPVPKDEGWKKGPPYFVHASCNEGSSYSVFIGGRKSGPL